MVTKVEMFYSQSKSMAMVASHFAFTSKIENPFLASKMKINNEWKK
jgi:hypothetical protein